jgi:predicted ArsR family transcriptional regulator
LEQVAEQLDSTVSGARQHLSALMREGLVEASELPAPAPSTKRGRRTLVYAATAAADAYFPKAYGELTNELLGYVADTDRELLDALFAKRREHRIAGARARLDKKRTLGAKLAELTRILDEDGYLASWEKVEPGVYRIVEPSTIWAVANATMLMSSDSSAPCSTAPTSSGLTHSRASLRVPGPAPERIGPDSSSRDDPTMLSGRAGNVVGC